MASPIYGHMYSYPAGIVVVSVMYSHADSGSVVAHKMPWRNLDPSVWDGDAWDVSFYCK